MGDSRRELSRLDTVLFLISAMVVLDTIGAIAIGGAQALTWLVVLLLLFFVPSALVCAELGAAIPQEGGAYVWVRRAFGQYAGSLTSFLYWSGVPMWIGGSVAAVAMSVCERFLVPLSMAGMFLFGAVLIAASTLGAVLPLRLGKWIPATGAIGQVVLLVVFTSSVLLYGVRHGFHGIPMGDFAPSRSVFIAVVPVLLFSFVGVELPATAGEEMKNPVRDLPGAIARAGLALAVLYAVPVVAVLVVLPMDRITSLTGLIDAMATSFTVFGGSIAADGTAVLTGSGRLLGGGCAVLFVWVLMASGSAWIMGAGRAQAAACLDGGGPRYFGRISRSGVPVRIGIASGAVSLAAMVTNLVVTAGNGEKYFSAALTVAIACALLAYLLIFPAFVALRVREPGLDRPFRVPGGAVVAWLITVLATGWALLATVCLLWPGLGTPDPGASLPAGFEGARAQFELLVLTPLVLIIVLTACYHRVSRRRGRVRAPAVIADVPVVLLPVTAHPGAMVADVGLPDTARLR